MKNPKNDGKSTCSWLLIIGSYYPTPFGATKIHANRAAPLRGSLVQDLPVVTRGWDTAGVDIALAPGSPQLIINWWFGVGGLDF